MVGVVVMVSANHEGTGSQPDHESHFHVTRLHAKVLRTCALMPSPESGVDCLMCAEFARQRAVMVFRKVDVRLPTSL